MLDYCYDFQHCDIACLITWGESRWARESWPYQEYKVAFNNSAR